jgi:opacity protein-like surface antigen
MKNKPYRSILGVLWLVLALGVECVYADFGVIDDNADASDYGNGQTGSFYHAINGGSTMSAADQQAIAAMLPLKEEDRFYGRARLNFTTLILENIKNKSSGGDANGLVNKKRFVSNQAGFELAVGYLWSPSFRGDIEYIVNKNINYIANPGLIGNVVTTSNLTATVKNNTILANLYYDFTALDRFKPYLTGGFGIAANSVQATLTPTPPAGSSQTLRKMGLAWAIGAGLRIGIFSHWYMDMSYRYVSLGSSINIQPNGLYQLQGAYTANVASIGFIYLF